ncbi:MAG TPA: methyltransferase domain-containing protein [Puia sp.]|nr:methyltransferase domain-containing protein [Puia sp.]
MEIISPVTGSSNTSLIRDIAVSDLISLYRKDHQLDIRPYFGDLQTIQLMQCNDTGYRFFYPFTIFGDDAFYQHLQQSDLYYLKEKWEYDKTISLIGDHQKVLEIGSGAGYLMEKLTAKGNCRVLTGLELNTKAVQSSKARGLNVINATIEDFAKDNAGAFDVAYALQVLEHVTNVRSFLTASLDALRPGGRLIICVPNNNPYLYRHDFFHTLNLPPHHAGLWNRASFGKLPDFFPMRLNNVFIEPLSDHKEWYQTQVSYLKERHHPAAGILSAVPATLYKNTLRLLKNFIEGRNIMVEFVKI